MITAKQAKDLLSKSNEHEKVFEKNVTDACKAGFYGFQTVFEFSEMEMVKVYEFIANRYGYKYETIVVDCSEQYKDTVFKTTDDDFYKEIKFTARWD